MRRNLTPWTGGADVDAYTVHVGRRELLDQEQLHLPESLAGRAADMEAQGYTAVYAGWDGHVHGVLAVADTLKDEATDVVVHHPERPTTAVGITLRSGRSFVDVDLAIEQLAHPLPFGGASARGCIRSTCGFGAGRGGAGLLR